MKTRFLHLFLSLTTICSIMLSCSNQPNSKTIAINKATFFKTLVVIGDDRSGSTSEIRKFTKEDYIEIISCITKKGGGMVATCLIGNPKPESKEPYIFFAEPLENIILYDPNDHNLTLSERGAMKTKNDKIIASNKLKLIESEQMIKNFIDQTIVPNVLNYQSSGKDYTDLDDALTRINTIINGKQYKEFDEIIVVIASDGVNEPGIKKSPILSKISNANAQVYLIGWKTSIDCFNVRSVDKLSEKSELLNIIKILNH